MTDKLYVDFQAVAVKRYVDSKDPAVRQYVNDLKILNYSSHIPGFKISAS